MGGDEGDEHNGTEENSIREVGLAYIKAFEIEKRIRVEGIHILILDNLEEQIPEERMNLDFFMDQVPDTTLLLALTS